MRLYIQEKDNLIKFNLPAKIEGSMLFSYKSFDTGFENSINIDAIDGNWVLKSNGNVNIISNSGYEEQIVLVDYMCIPVKVEGRDSFLCLFCLPSIEANGIDYSTENIETITIGNNSKNSITFVQKMMLPDHAIIKKVNNFWYIAPASNNANIYIYVNNKRVLSATALNTGDVIFMNGLRIIWMKQFIKIPMATNLYNINGLKTYGDSIVISNKDYTEVSETEINLPLYNENDYFSHTPRIKNIVEGEVVNIDAPPAKQEKSNDMPFLLSIGSSFTMLGMMSMNAYNIISSLASGEQDFTTQLPAIIMCCTMLLGSLLIPILTKHWQKKLEHSREIKRQVKYGEYLKKKEKNLDDLKAKQEAIMNENYIDLSGCLKVIETRNNLFWNREIRDDDFIELRLGVGNKPSLIKLSAPEEKFSLDDDNLYQDVIQLGKRYDTLENVPITLNLKEQIVSAIMLSRRNKKHKDEFINGLILQLMTFHSPLDLKIVLITDEAYEYKWNYFRYLPHSWSDDKKTRFFATTQEDLKSLCQFLDNEYNNRKARKKEREQASKEVTKDAIEDYELYDSYYLVITDNFKSIKNFSFTSDLLDSQYNYGFSMLIIDDDMKNLPKECQKFVVINDNDGIMFSGKIKKENTINFQPEFLSNIDMRILTRNISNVPIQGRDAESQLPPSLPFLEMYNVGKVEQLNVSSRWSNSDPMTTLAAPIGVHANGELFKLDLHEKYDGPHGLIAGSTGSGKSEFIITYVLSMALNYDPKEVQFVLIDYKGGGLAGAFENREKGISIPHLAGTITNLDTAEMNRTLVSIESELKRRQKKFNEVREKVGESTMDIYKYQKLYREGLIDEPISHLLIISDEFAELKSQQPDFMAQLVSTARIGRSLGVHLILATQKPSGVVNDQIWSNSKFKVCLKVQSRADSMEMLKRPEAASIKETGRFYLQVGYDEYFDIGQSAWSGEKYYPVERIVKKVDDSICFVDNFGSTIKQVNNLPKIEKVVKKDYGDQLTNIVKYLQDVAKSSGIKQNKLWLPALEKTILLDKLLEKYKYEAADSDIKPIIGEYDAPRIQEQGLLTLDLLNDGNLVVYGTPGSGKENLIFTIVYSLAKIKKPDEVNFYIGDFGAETLKILKKLPHVGDVFVTDDKVRVENLLKMLDKELERRKKDYADYGGNYIEYCRLTKKKETVMIVILNNYENYLETYPRMSDAFNIFFRDAFKYGIFFIVTAAVQTAIRGRNAQNFVNKICLKMPNDSDYRDLLGSPKGLVPVDNYGRGIVSVDGKRIYEFQTADIVNRDNRTQFIKEQGDLLKEKYGNLKARAIPVLPDIAYVNDVMFELKGLDCVPIGIEKNSLEVYVYNFLENKINLIAAKSIKSHIYFVYALIRQMTSLKNVNVFVIDALSIYRGNYKVTLFNDLEQAFVTMYNNVSKDGKTSSKNVYICLGISEFKNKVSSKYKNHFEALFKQVSKCKNNTFLFLDDSDSYKKIQVENWFRDNINNTFGIWLGEGIGSQVALGVMSLSLDDKQNVFPCIGFPIYQGQHMTVKYVVDGVDKTDE